jgi:hypothetical protein
MSEVEENPSVLLVRSTSHIRVLERPKNRLNSIMVGLQAGVVLFPHELYVTSISPFVTELFHITFGSIRNAYLTVVGALFTVYVGFCGKLEATMYPNEVFEEIENEAVESFDMELFKGQMAEEFEEWWEQHGWAVRAGGGQYEKTFAYEAWMHARGVGSFSN